MSPRAKIKLISSNILAWIISIVCLVPLILILFNSLKDSTNASDMNLKLPQIPLQWDNFLVVVEKGKLLGSFINSLTYSAGSVLLCTIFAALAAYVFSRNQTKLNKALYLYMVLGITMPINYVALTKVLMVLGLNNTRGGIVLLYTAMQLPFTVFLYHGFVAKVPVELDEAAIIDGCSAWKLFFYIAFPMMKPATATAVVLTFLNTWNEFVSPLYFLSNSTKWPMTLSVYNFFGIYFKDWNLVCADIVLTSVPVLLVYLLGQKYIVSGMTGGAVKG